MMHLRIRSKFFLMALLGVAAIILMFLLAQNILKDSQKRVEAVFEDSKKVQRIEQDMITPLFTLREATLSLIVSPEGSYRSDIATSLTPMIEKLDYHFKAMDAEIKDIWSSYKKLIFVTNGYKNYKRYVYVDSGYLKEDFKKGAFMHSKTVERKEFYSLIHKLKALQVQQLETSYKTFKKAENSFSKKQTIMIFSVMLVVVLTLLFGFLIARNIVFSIDSVQKGLESFFDLLGRKIDKDKKIGITLKSTDEFGEMAEIINTNTEALRAKLKKDICLIEDATSVLGDLKKGNLDRRLVEDASSNELNRLKDVINRMLNDLEARIILEIQEKTKQEKLLIQQSKLASIGNLIGNIAHQWRQPLGEINAVLMHMQVKQEHHDLSDEDFEKSIEECDVILSHMSSTISDFQNFFKPSKQKTLFSLEQECQKASLIIGASLKHNHIDFTILVKNDSNVRGYPREFAQAILNILSNAKDVLIERKIVDPYINMTLQKGHKFALIKIEDNAGGIAEEIKERIFEPYFTTKHAKQGIGIGLYMSKIIIEENMHGYINVHNTKKGARFIIKLAL